MKRNKIVALILSVITFFGVVGAFVYLADAPEMSIEQTKQPVRVENIYQDKYEPVKVSYWQKVQNIVNQGKNVVESTWSIGDTFVDSFNGSTVFVRLVDIAEDGTCTFMMDSVLESPLTYEIMTWDVDRHEVDLDYLYSDDEEGNRTWFPLVVRGLIGEYFLVLYEPPEDKLLLDYHWKANGMYDPNWIETESFDFNVGYSMFSLGMTFDPSVLKCEYYLLEFEADQELKCDWGELDIKYKTCVSEDLMKYAQDFRLPYAEELGIGDLFMNGAREENVWDYFRENCVFDENALTLIDKQSYFVHSFPTGEAEELSLYYSSFKGGFSNFWLEDLSFADLPCRFYVDELGDLHLIPKDLPLNEPISGSFRPCFKIKPQS